MRLHVLSDLHLEFGGAVHLPTTDAEVVILAGDIHLGREGQRWARKQFPRQPVIYVMGNHEFYRHSLPGLTELLQQDTEGSNICLLENGAMEIGGYMFLGCTLWTDFELTGNAEAAMRMAENGMSDYHVIRFNPEHRPLNPRDTAGLHHQSVAWLRQQLGTCDPARTVVITHHAPSPKSEAPDHADSPLKSAFSSNLDSLIKESGVPLWIHGHTHYNVDFKIGATRVLTNQHGYLNAPCAGFDPALVVDV